MNEGLSGPSFMKVVSKSVNQVYAGRAARCLLVLGGFSLSLIALYYFSKIAYPFIIAITISFIINPAVDFLEIRARLPRSLAVLLSLLAIGASITGFAILLVTEIAAGAQYLSLVIPAHIETIAVYLEGLSTRYILPIYNDLAGMFSSLDAKQQDTIIHNIQRAGSEAGAAVGSFIQSFLGKVPDILGWIPNAATVTVFSILATFFISKDWRRLSALEHRLPPRMKKRGKAVITNLRIAVFGFIKAQITLVSITAIIILGGLLVLKVDYAITIALAAGLVDIIPLAGTGVMFIPWIGFEIVTGQIDMAIGLSVLYAVVLVQRQIMEPKILSSSIGLNPLATLFSLFAGYKIFGLAGLAAGPAILVILTALHKANVFHDIWMFISGNEHE